MDLYKGKKFSSYKEFKMFMDEFTKLNYVNFSISDSKILNKCSLARARRVAFADEKLKYYSLKMSCVFGRRPKIGQKKQSGKKERQRRTCKRGCSAYFSLLLSSDAKYLEIVEGNLEHNHEISKEIFENMHQQRKLPPEAIEKIRQFLKLKVDTKTMREVICRETGKKVTSKDIFNVVSKLKMTSSLDEKFCPKSAVPDKIDTADTFLLISNEIEISETANSENSFDSTCKIDVNRTSHSEAAVLNELEISNIVNLETSFDHASNMDEKMVEAVEMHFEDKDTFQASVTEHPTVLKISATPTSLSSKIQSTNTVPQFTQKSQPHNLVPVIENCYPLAPDTVQIPIVYLTKKIQPPQPQNLLDSPKSISLCMEKLSASLKSLPSQKNSSMHVPVMCVTQIPDAAKVPVPQKSQPKQVNINHMSVTNSASSSKKDSSTSTIENSFSSCEHDDFDTYGQYLASEIRSIKDARQCSILKVKLQLLIFKAQQGLLSLDE